MSLVYIIVFSEFQLLQECMSETSGPGGPFISLFETISMSLPFLPSSFITITIYDAFCSYNRSYFN